MLANLLKNHSLIKIILFFIFVIMGSAPYLYYQFNVALNTNHAWLLIVAQRFWEGGEYGYDFFEPNPPMSVIIYIPQYLIHHWLHIPLHYVPALFGVLFVALSVLVSYTLLKNQNIFKDKDLNFCFLVALALAGIFIPGNFYFSERDHYVFLALVPCCLGQILITNGQSYSNYKAIPSFIFAGLILLIKPHYGVFAYLIFCHRAIKTRSLLSVIRSSDFIGLALSPAIYAAIIFIFFNSYITEVLPSFLEIYLTKSSNKALTNFFLFGFALFVLFFCYFFIETPKYKKIMLLLYCASFVSLCLFAIQGKNFPYHLIPALSFLYISMVIILYALIKDYVAKNHRFISLLIICIFSLFIAYKFRPPHINSLQHTDYLNTALGEAVKKCSSPCPHYIFSESMETIFQISLYSGEIHASRFPGLWWIDHTVDKNASKLDANNYFSKAMVEDFQRYNPKMLIIARNLPVETDENFDLISYLSSNSNFAKIMKNYSYSHSFDDNRADYFKGTDYDYEHIIQYDVYYRHKKKRPE